MNEIAAEGKMICGIVMHISTFNPILQMRKCLSPLLGCKANNGTTKIQPKV